ncbi:MAG: LemA family protein [Solirubrobacterales bacterium]
MSPALLIIIGAGLAIGLAVGLVYNRMVARRNAVDSSWSQIDVQLRKRHDLIPPLVEAVKGYAAHERTTFQRVSETRSAAEQATGVGDRASAERALTGATGALLVVAENYPQLEASANFSKLQTQLREVEDQIAIARRVYNDTVETYNTLVQVFPAVIVAKLFGFTRREFFDAPTAAEATPEVDLSPAPEQA